MPFFIVVEVLAQQIGQNYFVRGVEKRDGGKDVDNVSIIAQEEIYEERLNHHSRTSVVIVVLYGAANVRDGDRRTSARTRRSTFDTPEINEPSQRSANRSLEGVQKSSCHTEESRYELARYRGKEGT